jgi:hypothetical protein
VAAYPVSYCIKPSEEHELCYGWLGVFVHVLQVQALMTMVLNNFKFCSVRLEIIIFLTKKITFVCKHTIYKHESYQIPRTIKNQKENSINMWPACSVVMSLTPHVHAQYSVSSPEDMVRTHLSIWSLAAWDLGICGSSPVWSCACCPQRSTPPL